MHAQWCIIWLLLFFKEMLGSSDTGLSSLLTKPIQTGKLQFISLSVYQFIGLPVYWFTSLLVYQFTSFDSI
jgi:hypothetical protein